MNPNYTEFKFPSIETETWSKVFSSQTPRDAVEFVASILRYDPKTRLHPFQALSHTVFNELRAPLFRLPDNAAVPPLFNFTDAGKLPLCSAPTTSVNRLLRPTNHASQLTSSQKWPMSISIKDCCQQRKRRVPLTDPDPVMPLPPSGQNRRGPSFIKNSPYFKTCNDF